MLRVFENRSRWGRGFQWGARRRGRSRPRYRRPSFTEWTIYVVVPARVLVDIINWCKHPTRIGARRNRGEDHLHYFVAPNDHYLDQLDLDGLGQRLLSGGYRVDARQARAVLDLAGYDTRGMTGFDVVDELREIVERYSAAEQSQ